MANEIHNYSIERFVFGDDDYYDIDWFDGSVYRTAKIKGSVIKAGILAGASDVNIYNSDGTITGNRTIDADNNFLTFDNVTNLRFNTQGAPFGVSGFEINATPTGNLFTVKNAGSGVVVLKVSQDGVFINNDYKLPTTDGTAGQVMTTDGAGQVTFQNLPAPTTDTNIYNTNGTLTANRTVTGSNFQLLFQTLGQFIVESHQNGIDGNVIFEVRTDATNHSFIIRDHNTNVHVFACRNGAVEISDAYFLPTNTGTNGQVLTSDGAGNSTWQTPTPATEFIPKISGFNVNRFYIFTNGSATVFFSGMVSGGVGGTQGAIFLSGATPTKIIRTRFTSGTSSGSIAGYRGNSTDYAVGMGWHAVFTFGHADTSFNSSAHNWVGLGNAITFQIGSLTYASSLGNIIGVGNDPSDTTLQILHNDSTGTATKIPLGSDFPSNRTAGSAFTGMFCLELFNDYGSTQVKWRMTRIDTGTVEQGTITTNLPSTSTFLCPVASRSNGSSTSLACIMDVASIQIFTKY